MIGGKKGPTPGTKAVLKEVAQFIKWVPPIPDGAVDIDEESFTLLLSGISTCLVMPGIPEPMDYTRMYRWDPEENAALASAPLYERYGISDGIPLASVAADMVHAQEEYQQFELALIPI